MNAPAPTIWLDQPEARAIIPAADRDDWKVRPSVRETMARVLGEADAAQYRPSGNRPSLTALAEHEREQRVFGMISDAAALYASKGHAK